MSMTQRLSAGAGEVRALHMKSGGASVMRDGKNAPDRRTPRNKTRNNGTHTNRVAAAGPNMTH
jgi:hypothetical protein